MFWLRSPASLRPFASGLLVLVVLVVPMRFGHARQANHDRRTWTDYGGGPDNARYLTLDQINKGSIARLDVAWTYPSRGGPAMYEVNGRQFLVVNATQGPTRPGDAAPGGAQRAYVAFALRPGGREAVGRWAESSQGQVTDIE
jgi:hypothetical protein